MWNWDKLKNEKMKIGIVTLPLRTNYGGILQAYALHTFIVLDKLTELITN